ncbi:MAG: CotH kinase family protein [Bacteroidaceae bacterium]
MRRLRLLHTILLLIIPFVSALAENVLLTGTVIGTEQSVDYSTGASSTTVNTCACAFDGNMDTFFASYERNLTWAGLDLGAPHVITRIGWAPRKDTQGPTRTLLGVFEGSNRPDFLDAVPLYVIDAAQPSGQMSYADVNVSLGFRYVRYVGPHDARCNIAELAFYGYEGEGDETRFYQMTNLPTVVFHTVDAVDPYDKEHDLTSQFAFIYDGGSKVQRQTGTSRLRGNASMGHPKKPYRIKFDASSRIFKDSELRSPAKAKKWTLINNYSDKTLMRNLVAFEMGRRMGFDYVPWSQPVDVILNGEYRGCYQLTDQLTVDANRINITEMTPADNEGEALTGGYLVELDGYAEREVSWFRSVCGNPITIKSPGETDITPQQFAYIQNAFNEMEMSILSGELGEGDLCFRDHLDEKSLITYFLTEEICGNPDAFWSCYMTKERGSNLFRVGPIWDFDIAFDNDYRYFPVNDQGDFLNLVWGGAGNSRSMLNMIFQDQAFCDSLTAVWNHVRESGIITPENVTGYIDSLADVLQESQRLNFMRWPILDTKVQVNPRAAGSYEGEVQWLREFMQNRIPWIDNRVNNGNGQGEDLFFEIGTPEQLMDFANHVNNGMVKASARLTADIDMTSSPSLMIGTSANGYAGDFDGAGHRVTLALTREVENAALFNSLSGCVHDLIVDGTIRTSAKYAAGIASELAGGRIQRCQSLVSIESTVNGDGTHGGIAAVSYEGSLVEDCLVNISMTGASTQCCGGVVGWASGFTSIRNCLVTGDISVSVSGSDLLSRNSGNVSSLNNYVYLTWEAPSNCADVQQVDEQQVVYGATCFMLNNTQTTHQHWFQTLGMDSTPVPDSTHGTIYSTSHLYCDGTPYTILMGYTNNKDRSNRDEHILEDGFCVVCGAIDMDNAPCDERGYYKLSSSKHLEWFARQVDAGLADMCGVLTADIDMSAQSDFMIGRSCSFAGVLDGAGHSITIAQEVSTDNAGLIGFLSGTLQDITVRGSLTTSRKYAGMVGNLQGGKVLRCQSYIDIHATINGDGTHGGLVGLVSESSRIGQVRDCLFAGSIQGEKVNCCGGLVGWASSMYLLSNCLMLGDISIDTNGCNMLSRNPGQALISNCYYTSPWQVEIPANAVSVSEQEQADGSLCYRLNRGVTDGSQAWYQTLDLNPYPLPDRSLSTVYCVEDTYTNNLSDAIHAPVDNGRMPSEDAIYDLSGRRVSRPVRGIYLQGGRLVVK